MAHDDLHKATHATGGDDVLTAADVPFTPDGSIAATTVQTAIVEVRDEAGGGGAPTTADYLVGTAQGGLSAEIVVGATPGGELGGTWASPTVDGTHAGSAHHDPVTVGTGLDVTGQLVDLDLSEVAAGGELGGFMDAPTVDSSHAGGTHAATQSAAEATAASALSTHAGAADPHTGYVQESLVDAAGDLIVGTADNTVGRLAKGTALQVLRTNAGATALEWAAAAGAVATDTLFDAKGDLPVGTGADTAAKLAAGTQGQVLGIDASSASGLLWHDPDVWGMYLPIAGIAISNIPRYIVNGVAGSLTSGTLKLLAIWLPKNFTVTSISWLSGTTALSLGTSPHSWHALFDSSLGLLRQSNDDTAPAWAASVLRTVNLSSTFTTTYAGLHYIGCMIAMTGGTMPTLATFSASIAAYNTLAPATGGNSSTGQGATAPSTAAAISGATVLFYGGVA